MRASLFEIWKLTQRTLEGAGVPDGHDREGAFAVQWLTEHGFPGFAMFDESAPKLAGLWKLSISGNTELEASGAPLVSFGADAMDYCAAIAESSENGEASIVVRNTRGPGFLIPYAARRCLNAGACRIEWTDGKGHEFSVIVAGPETVWIDCVSDNATDPEQALCDVTGTVDVTITFDRDGADLRAEDDAPEGKLLSPATLKERHMQCLANGIEVDQALWDRMQKTARVVLVPATELSREMGAGGGDAND